MNVYIWNCKLFIPTQCINLCRQESRFRRKPLRSAVHLEHCTVAILRPSSLWPPLPNVRKPLSTVYPANRLLLFRRLPWPLGTLSPPTVVFHSAFNTVGVPWRHSLEPTLATLGGSEIHVTVIMIMMMMRRAQYLLDGIWHTNVTEGRTWLVGIFFSLSITFLLSQRINFQSVYSKTNQLFYPEEGVWWYVKQTTCFLW